MENNELIHYGVRGMRWGIRRYQNSDGTLTSAGKRRYDKEMGKLKAEEQILNNREQTKAKLDELSALRKSNSDRKKALDAAQKPKGLFGKKAPKKPKSLKDMSDDELNDVIKRLDLEKKYRDLMQQTNPPKSTKGRDFIMDTLETTGKKIVPQIMSHYAAKLANQLIGETTEVKDKETGEIKEVIKEVIYANNKKKD